MVKTFDKIPDSPCHGCVPPERTADCHAKCQKYLVWEAHKNRINQEIWAYKDGINYTSISMMRLEKIKRRKRTR